MVKNTNTKATKIERGKNASANKNIIHVSVRSARNSIRSKVFDNQLRPFIKTKSQGHIQKVYSIEHTPTNESAISSSKKKVLSKSTINSFQFKRNNSLRRENSTDEFIAKEKKKRYRYLGAYCCRCSPLCQFCCIITTILLLAALAALLTAFIKSKSTTTTTESMSSATTVTTTGTTTITPRPMCPITAPGDPIKGLYNTVAGGATGGFQGRYSTYNEKPPQAIDNNLTTKYLNYGTSSVMNNLVSNPGKDTGFYVTPNVGYSLANGVLFTSANDLLYNGTTGLEIAANVSRLVNGTIQTFLNSFIYRSYRLLITSQRGIQDSVRYAELHIMRYC